MPNIYKFLLFCCPYKHDYLSVRCSRVTTVNALKKIGYIGPVPECSTGNKTLIFHIPYTTENFQTIQNPYILLSFCLYVHYDAVSIFRNTSLRLWAIIRYLPRSVGMRRIALHKSVSAKGDKMYLLVCECADLLKDISAAAVLIPALRARLCGYTGLYRPIQAF